MAALGTGAIFIGFTLPLEAGYKAYKNGPDRGFGLAAMCVIALEAVGLGGILIMSVLPR